ncbi:putative ribonuclease H-like domain-containing protein [Tanacetum coccineum]
MQEELLQFKLQKVWTLMDLPNSKRPIGTKWVYRNKARLVVAQWYTQEEGIDYDEVFASVTRIEVIRLFLAYASFKDFVVYQIDVKSAFLYEKALYGLHQAPRAWYETLSTYLLDNGFQKGKIDKTLFIRRDKGDILKRISHKRTKNKAKTDKTKHGMEKHGKAKVKSKQKIGDQEKIKGSDYLVNLTLTTKTHPFCLYKEAQEREAKREDLEDS